MRKFLSILGGISMVATASTPVMAMSPIKEKEYQPVKVSSIVSKFTKQGTWQDLTDSNVPDWAKSDKNTDSNYTFGREIKKDSWKQTSDSSVSFVINFSALGGNYQNALNHYNINELSNYNLNMRTQAGQPAHNKSKGWEDQTNSFSLLELLNEGKSFSKENVVQRSWGEWAGFDSDLYTTWSSDQSQVKITWKINDANLKATKWTDGMYINISLDSLDGVIQPK